MKNPHLILALTLILIALSATQVFAQSYAPEPIVGAKGAPALSGNNMSGVIVLQYANIKNKVPLVLQTEKVTLQVCGTGGCANVVADLSNTGPGTYAYTFPIPPSPTGSVTITLPARGLADAYGKPFPSTDTQVGSYSTPSPGTPSTSNPPPSGIPSLPANSPQPVQHPGLYREAVPIAASPNPEAEHKPESYTTQAIVSSIILTLTAFGLLLLPRNQ
jgi:hypothetical protein